MPAPAARAVVLRSHDTRRRRTDTAFGAHRHPACRLDLLPATTACPPACGNRRGGGRSPKIAQQQEETAMFIRNAWYVAAWADEIAETPLARRICNEPVVLFR